jgi:hypothetical protein
MNQPYNTNSDDETEAFALRAVAWTLSDESRAQRMLSLTGLEPDELRAGLTQPVVLRAMLDFLLDYEPDLLACAAALGVRPERILACRDEPSAHHL